MKHLLTIALVIFGLQAQAQIGSPTKHELLCSNPTATGVVEIQYSVICTMAPRAPKHSLLACAVQTIKAYPWELLSETVLTLSKQTAKYGYLHNRDFRVQLDKTTMIARLKTSKGEKQICGEVAPPIGGGFSVGNQ